MHLIPIYLSFLFVVTVISNPLKGHYRDPNYPDGIRVVIPYNDHTIEVYAKNAPD